jgi:hypothetical protein
MIFAATGHDTQKIFMSRLHLVSSPIINAIILDPVGSDPYRMRERPLGPGDQKTLGATDRPACSPKTSGEFAADA